jgi:phosphate uptake regulator
MYIYYIVTILNKRLHLKEMKRKIVQHGPSTLTISLPAKWVKDFALKKGDELSLEQMRDGLFITTGKERHFGRKRINVRGMPKLVDKATAALYKGGYDEIIVEYQGAEELEIIHACVNNNYLGFEIVDEKKDEVWLRKVSEPTSEEFKTLFRRIFYFIISTAEDGLDAATKKDKQMYQKLILRDTTVNKLTNFCRRIVNKRGQSLYQHDPALYHILEQLEKVGDSYKDINRLLLKNDNLSKTTLALYEKTNNLLKGYEDLFFSFTLPKMDEFFKSYDNLAHEIEAGKVAIADQAIHYRLHEIARELYNLSGVTMILHL